MVQHHTIPSRSTPQCCLLFLARFGNLIGKIDVFGRRTLNKNCNISAPSTSYCSWSHQVAGSVVISLSSVFGEGEARIRMIGKDHHGGAGRRGRVEREELRVQRGEGFWRRLCRKGHHDPCICRGFRCQPCPKKKKINPDPPTRTMHTNNP